ncbi:stabilin-2 isoform X1 [Octopus sinensis]|uniref:Stabilin-2 isoform X1 n=1 Tax=Octopus sinensis TaxID=2607531 RepID=A0A6P7T4A0_9MOLL|nr:stabilin-2 isoform X1 [Octopus sinensis]
MSHSLTTAQNTFLFIAITNLIFGLFWTTVTSQSNTKQNFCKHTYVHEMETKCSSCDTELLETCGEYQLIPSSKQTCRYFDSGTELQGCLWSCKRNVTRRVCCPGFWGDSCLECPGGADNPCYGNGACADGKCTCYPKYAGEECERCSEELVFGPNCTDCTCLHGTCDSGILGTGKCECESGFKGPLCDEEIPRCGNIHCGKNESCREDDEGNPVCKCENGYEKNENGECQAQSACASSPCPVNSNCIDLAPGKYDCICHENYKNIGRRRCAPINPCAMNNGGCQAENSYCVFLGPGRRQCRCNDGYEWIDGTGCRLKDLCLTNPYPCHKYAMCKTIPPEELLCVCKEGYIGNGRTECIGNLVDQIADMNDEDEIGKNRLNNFLMMLQKVYKGELTKHGNYTVFVPLDRGFSNLLQDTTFGKFLENSDHVRQILRQHIFPVSVYIDDLTDNTFYTLQGNFARFFYKGKKLILKFQGSSRRSRVLAIYRDIRASNGLIHIVNNLMMNEPEIPGNLNQDFVTFIMGHPDFQEFGSWITRTGLEKQFRRQNITVFLPSKTSLDKIPKNVMDYLKSKNGIGTWIGLVKNHLLQTKRTITDLIDSKKMYSLGRTTFRIKISSNGQIHFGPNANMTQSGVPVKNGIVHLIEGLLFPDDLETLVPHNCDNVTFKAVHGECGLCESDLHCLQPSDIPTDKIYKNCTYQINLKYTYSRRKGCQRICRRKVIDRQCCQGFFGPNCEPCPGGLNNPCYGRGTCFDGINGNGTCKCKEGFGKEACRGCAADDVFGPQCTEKCTCRYGECDSGVNGSGQCKKSSCQVGFKGRNCDRQITSCNGKVSICPAVTECLENNEIRCLCWPGYEGDGNQCTEIDPCKNPNICHEQATCTKTGPGKNNCTCNEGWVGDGHYCHVAHICMLHRDCDQNAECQLSGPGGSVCICKDGFIGDGKTCTPQNPCKIDNGGCHRNALCEMTGIGERECVCRPGYVGEGLSCFSTIMGEIRNQPDLSELSDLLKDVTYFWEENEKYTFLAPNNIAVLKFKQRASVSYWQEQSNILDLIAFHTLNGSYSMDTLQQMNQEEFKTSMTGFNVMIVTNETNVMVTTRETSAAIIKTDILSSNGYIHIIDQVLEPFLENQERPSLSEFFSAHPEYSTFSEALLDNGLVDKLEDMDDYTLFVPDKNAMQDCSQKLGFRVLSYYILPFTLMSASMTNGLKVKTSLGQLHQLIFRTQEHKVFVNDVSITLMDVLTVGGIIHIINGCLVPVLHRCDNEVMETNKTSCISCDEEFTCPPEYHKVAVLKHVCSYKTPEGELLGCTALCRRLKVTPACCYGYYGPECEECPGGADYPCSGQGNCSDGLDGTGLCSCKANFTSSDCSTYIAGNTKPDHSQNDKCGGCPPSSECKQNQNSEWSCECADSYVLTDKDECRSPCTIANGNCHQNAVCSFGPEEKISGQAKCVCRSGYHGDGLNFCQPIVNLCNMNNGNCSPRAECTFIPPPANAIVAGQVKCECYSSYIGNGTTCNRDILSTLEYMPSMRLFCDLLILRDVSNDKQRSDLIQMLENINQNLTVFVPVNGLDYNHNLSTQDVMNHVVARKIYIDSDTEASSYKTLAGQSVRLQKSSSGELYIIQEEVVEIRILETNILNMNGYIHIMETPLWYEYKVTAKVKEEGPHRVVGVVLGVFSVLLIILLIVLYKKYASNIFLCDIWQRYRMTSDSEISFSHLKTHESHEMLDQLEQPLTTDIQNQIYDTEELLLEERTLD